MSYWNVYQPVGITWQQSMWNLSTHSLITLKWREKCTALFGLCFTGLITFNWPCTNGLISYPTTTRFIAGVAESSKWIFCCISELKTTSELVCWCWRIYRRQWYQKKVNKSQNGQWSQWRTRVVCWQRYTLQYICYGTGLMTWSLEP